MFPRYSRNARRGPNQIRIGIIAESTSTGPETSENNKISRAPPVTYYQGNGPESMRYPEDLPPLKAQCLVPVAPLAWLRDPPTATSRAGSINIHCSGAFDARAGIRPEFGRVSQDQMADGHGADPVHNLDRPGMTTTTNHEHLAVFSSGWLQSQQIQDRSGCW